MALFRSTKNLVRFSPCGKYFARALQQELIVQNTASLGSVESFTFDDTIESFGWSPNGQYIFCASTKKGIIRIYSAQHPQWKCKLTGSCADFDNIIWSFDSKTLLIVSDLKIYISIWTLANQDILNIWNLKSSSYPNIVLNKLREIMAVIVCIDGVDSVEMYETNRWELCRKLICNKLFGIDGISWSNNGELLAIWCATIGKSRMLIYSTVTNAHIGAFSGNDSFTDQEFITMPYRCRLQKSIGEIEKVSWSPNGQLLAVAGSNEMVAVINYATWSIVFHVCCKPVLEENDHLSRVFKEIENNIGNCSNYLIPRKIPENYKYPCELNEMSGRPINITIAVRQNDHEICIAVTRILEFSPCGMYLVMNHQLHSSTLLIRNLMNDHVDYILSKNSISGVSWDPKCTRILIFSGSPIIIEWRSGQKPKYFESPRKMKVLNGHWHPNGEIIALHGYNKTTMIRLKD